MAIASRGHDVLPFSEVSPECEAVVQMNSWSAPASARAADCDGFSWVSDESVNDMSMWAVFVAEGVVLSGDMAVHFW